MKLLKVLKVRKENRMNVKQSGSDKAKEAERGGRWRGEERRGEERRGEERRGEQNYSLLVSINTFLLVVFSGFFRFYLFDKLVKETVQD